MVRFVFGLPLKLKSTKDYLKPLEDAKTQDFQKLNMKDRYVFLKDKHWNFKKFKVDEEEVNFGKRRK